MEVESEAYSVYCKRGRREAMEDRYSAALNLQGDPKQVMLRFLSFSFLLLFLPVIGNRIALSKFMRLGISVCFSSLNFLQK